MRQTRRQFLGTSAGLMTAAAARPLWAQEAPRPKIAIVVTACFYRSHAHVLLENFLEPYLFSGRLHQPSVDVVALYAVAVACFRALYESGLVPLR